MSVFLEPTHLFPRYMCQAGVLAEFLLIYLHSELGKSGKPKKKKKSIYWEVDLEVYIFVSQSSTEND